MDSLKRWLELQCDRVEAVLMAHYAPVRIIGGTVSPHQITFTLQPAPYTKHTDILSAYDDLVTILGEDLKISHSKGQTQLSFGGTNRWLRKEQQIIDVEQAQHALTAQI